ncbi:MAG TPA: 3-deoxy-manno-octulosonate cytidylyltransferase [Candidatus Didemnitutus sp.]|nr:3-deoxy-manno-octulosonate cytidylyltransferase [Candidatus Didemnitutus sp.]
MPAFAIIVPCRLESTRFPRKLLHPIKGKPLVLWVAERISEQAPDLPLWFAVDHELLAECIEGAGFRAIMTDAKHPSGTDRIAEANRRVRASYVINVQADEPLVSNSQIQALARMIQGSSPMATLCTRFKRAEDFYNPNQVKVVMSPATGRALYFSRSPMPYARDAAGKVDDAWLAGHPSYKHLGLYAYHGEFLEKFVALPPGRLEQIEKLEQLRALENGHAIAVDVTEDPSVGVDTPEDGKKFEQLLEAK